MNGTFVLKIELGNATYAAARAAAYKSINLVLIMEWATSDAPYTELNTTANK